MTELEGSLAQRERGFDNDFPPNELIEFGPKSVETVSIKHINELEQVRKTYPTEQIQELASSIAREAPDGSIQFELLNPPICAYLTPEEAETYLEQYAIFNDIPTPSLSEFTPDSAGNYIFLIAGHRRKRAIESLIDSYDLDPDKVVIQSSLRRGISFEEALLIQIAENTHEKPQPEELAKYIENFYTYLTDTRPEKAPTVREISARTGLSIGVVRSALEYCRLPDQVQDLVKRDSKTFPYSTAVMLAPLMRTYERYYDFLCQKSGDNVVESEKETYVAGKLLQMSYNILRIRLDKTAKVQELVDNTKRGLEQEMQLSQESFALVEDYVKEAEASGVDRARNHLGRTAVSSLKLAYGENLDQMPDDIRKELADLVERAKNAATSISEAQSALEF